LKKEFHQGYLQNHMKLVLRLFVLFSVLVLSPFNLEGKQLQFINQKTGKITSFQPGDHIGYILEGSLNPKRTGKLTDFNQEQIMVHKKTFELNRIIKMWHVKPVPNLILSLLGYGVVIISFILFFPVLLPIPKGNLFPLVLFTLIWIASFVSKEIINGYKVNLAIHSMKYIETEDDLYRYQQNHP